MKKKLLIIVARLLDGGIDTILLEYLKAFDQEKFQITLAIGICMEELEKYIHQIPSNIKIEYLVRKHNLIKYRKKKVQNKLPFILKLYDEIVLNPIRRTVQNKNLQKLIKENDVVIDFDTTFYAFLKKCLIPKIAFFHFSFKQYHNANLQKMKRLGKKMSVYDKIVTACDEMKEEGEIMFPHLKNNFVTIYNSFNFETIIKKSSEPIPEQPRYILAVERFDETKKDVTTLLKAYKILVDKYDVAEKLYVIGEGNSRTQLENLRQELGLNEKVHFWGFLSNPYPWMKECKLFVLSSKSEGFGNVLVEAMVLKVPIISTNCPTGPKEILEYGKSGLLVPVGDENAMAESIHLLLNDSQLRNSIVENASVHVENFSIKNNIIKIETLIFSEISKK